MRDHIIRITGMLPGVALVLTLAVCGVPVCAAESEPISVKAATLNAVDSADIDLKSDTFMEVEVMPEMIRSASPVYPKEQKEKGVEATVWVQALIGRSGTVLKATIHKAEGAAESFQRSALDAALQCTYKPALAKGKPVPVWVTYKVSFVLSDKGAAPKSPDAPK